MFSGRGFLRWTYWLVLCYSLKNGQAKIEYADHAFETLDLNAVRWVHTRKGQKAFLPFSTNCPKFPLKKIRQKAKEIKTCLSVHHTVKGFADDMMVISPNISAHSSALKIIDQKASSLDFNLKPDKCV